MDVEHEDLSLEDDERGHGGGEDRPRERQVAPAGRGVEARPEPVGRQAHGGDDRDQVAHGGADHEAPDAPRDRREAGR